MTVLRLLLVNTPINLHSTLGRFAPIYNDMKMVPTGIAYLAAFVREAGIEVSILDQFAEGLTLDEMSDRIKAFAPDLIGYSATTQNYAVAIALVREMRTRHPSVLTVMGGQHPSIRPDETLQDDAVDFVIRDEGEYPLMTLCHALETKGSFDGILGLSYKGPLGRVHNEKVPHVDVNALPFPAYDLLPMRQYSSPSYTKFASPCYQMTASRGCPYQCTYCINAELNIAAKYRRRDIDSVVAEMELLADKYGARQIQFWDPIFPLGHEHAMQFCERLMQRGLHRRIVWNSTTRADALTDDAIKMMARAGCRGLGFGIESGVPEMLATVRKKVDFDKVRQVCRTACQSGIVVVGAFIIGFPGETRQMTQQTIDFAKSLDIHYAQFSVLVPYPGTPLHRELMEKGEIGAVNEQDYTRFNQSIGLTDMEPVFVPKGRTSAELKAMQKQAYLEFYLRPRMVWLHLPHLRPSTIAGVGRSLSALLTLAVQRLAAKLPGRRGAAERTAS